MSISSKTRKMLWGRAANRCAICRAELVMDETETDDESVIGDECHIVAREDDGPRGESIKNSDQRDKYANLLLLCKIHHKVIDDQPGHYTVEKLNKIKEEHEQWVRSSLNIDINKQKEEELYMAFVEKWSNLCDLDNWKDWTSWLLSAGSTSMSIEMEAKLQEVKSYLFSRVWPNRYLELNDSFENFREILGDFLSVFHEYSQKKGDDYCIEKFYKIQEWDVERYDRLAKEYEFHITLVQDLILELTRAGNYICDKIREFLMSTYRMNEGLLIIESGPYTDMRFHKYRTKYRNEERINKPYPGLDEFKKIRNTRDINFGVGISSEDSLF
ncbi:hypothetical protein HF638_04215 [Paenibacillus sp. SZ31]|uniref:HNH endonuclease n=1 Tax=Paenibacillus sp. SZ31 TaxID=2725555 RepID=UPI00146A2175|nr:HNH endonuclease [Paenibacillus sp. SZ31]NMI03164.1 hypothetical protein [Paenibacillus sp. SZ31]